MMDANQLAEFLMNVCETDTMKNVVAECLLMKKTDIEAVTKDRPIASRTSRMSSTRNIHSRNSDLTEQEDSFAMECDDQELEDDDKTYLECMMDFVTKLEFPQKIVTFLLHLLPCPQYKVC